MTTTDGFRIGFEDGAALPATTLAWHGERPPAWLRGTYLKNGPGLFTVGTQRYRHWFDGLALLVGIDFGDEVVAHTRYLASPDWEASTAGQRIAFTEFATAPSRSWWQRIRCTLAPNAQFGANASINIVEIDGDAVAIGDLPGGLVVDPASLTTTGEFHVRQPLLVTSTPHPQRDPAEASWSNAGLGLSWRGFGYRVFALDDGSHRPRSLAFIPNWRPAYMHSIGMSGRYVVLMEHPMYASLPRFLTLALRQRPIIDAFRWDGDAPMRIYLVDRRGGGLVHQVEVPAAFYFHTTGVFDDGDDVVVDMCTYPDDRVIDELYLDRLRQPDGGHSTPATLRRYRIRPGHDDVETSVLTSASVEFPTKDPRRSHSPYRYTYAVSMDPGRPDDYLDRLVKVDVETGEFVVWEEDGCYPSEPYMVPRPDGDAEDDGVVISVVLDGRRAVSMLVVLDARSFDEIGRADLPGIIPFGLHGRLIESDPAA